MHEPPAAPDRPRTPSEIEAIRARTRQLLEQLRRSRAEAQRRHDTLHEGRRRLNDTLREGRRRLSEVLWQIGANAQVAAQRAKGAAPDLAARPAIAEIVAVGARGVIELVSPGLCARCGYEPGELFGAPLGALLTLPGSDAPVTPPTPSADAKDAPTVAIAVNARHKDGLRLPLQLSWLEVRRPGSALYIGLVHGPAPTPDPAAREAPQPPGATPLEAVGARAAEPAVDVLGAREREVLRLVASGDRTSVIARKLHISENTVETHRRNIMRKLSIRSVAELTRYAIRTGLAPL